MSYLVGVLREMSLFYGLILFGHMLSLKIVDNKSSCKGQQSQRQSFMDNNEAKELWGETSGSVDLPGRELARVSR